MMRRVLSAVLISLAFAGAANAQTETPTPTLPYCLTATPGPTPTNIPATYYERVLEMDPLAYWRLNDTSGTAATESINGWNGTYSGPTLNGSTFVNGDAAPSFDAVNDYVDLYTSSLSSAWNTNAGGVSMWIKLGSGTDWTTSTERWALHVSSAEGWRMYVRKELNTLTIRAGGYTYSYSVTDLGANWHNIVMTWSGGTAVIYLNGVQIGTGAATWAGQPVTIFRLSGETTSLRHWYGAMANVVVFDRLVTSTEAAALAQAQFAVPTPVPTALCQSFNPTPTPTWDLFQFQTMPAPQAGTPGQPTAFVYTVSAGEKHNADLVQWLLYSVWGFFLFGVIVLFLRYRRS